MRSDDRYRLFEENARSVVGRRLTAVRYFEIDYEDPITSFDWAPQVGHLLDFGLDLLFGDGSVLGIIWDAQFAQYGVGLRPHSITKELRAFTDHDLSDHPRWSPIVGSAVTEALVCWAHEDTGGSCTRYPQEIRFCFRHLHYVFVSASQYDDERDMLFPMSDDIAVIFDAFTAAKYGLGLARVDRSSPAV